MTLRRVPEWWPRLQAVAREFDGRPFVFGETDCAVFAARCFEAVTGEDALGTYRGAYTSRLSAFARLKFRGHRTVGEAAGAALEALGCVPVDPRCAMVGDIGATDDDVLAVRFPRGFIARTPEGLYGEPLRIEKAWAVAWNS